MDNLRGTAKRWSIGLMASAVAVLAAMMLSMAPAYAQGGGAKGGSTGILDPAALSIERPYIVEQMQSQYGQAIGSAVRGHIGALLTSANPFAVSSAGSPAFAYAQPEQKQSYGLAAFAAVDATPKWSTWADLNATWSDRNDPIAGNQGWLETGSVAVDYRIVDRGVIGVIGSFAHGDYGTTFSTGTFRSWAYGGGVYSGYALTDVIIVDGLAQWQALDNNVSTPTATGSYGGNRVQLAAHITAYLTHDVFSIRPAAGISYTHDDYDAYVDSAGAAVGAQWSETTTGTVGVEVGRVYDLGGGRSIEPWLGVTTLLESTKSTSGAVVPNRELDPFDVLVSAGLRTQLGKRLSFTLRAELGGLARSDYSTVLADGTFALEF